jgi:uncharacterized membrane protein YpjA
VDLGFGAIVFIGLLVLPFLRKRWSRIVSLVFAGCVVSYGLMMIFLVLSEGGTNSDLVLFLSTILIAIGGAYGALAWFLRPRASHSQSTK